MGFMFPARAQSEKVHYARSRSDRLEKSKDRLMGRKSYRKMPPGSKHATFETYSDRLKPKHSMAY